MGQRGNGRSPIRYAEDLEGYVPRENRTISEKITDAALLLCLWDRSARQTTEGHVGDRLKAMKLAFVATHTMFERLHKGLNCTFYKWDYGPISNDVYQAWDTLKAGGLLREDEVLYLTSDGEDLAGEFWRDVLCSEGNEVFENALASVAGDWGGLRTSTILGRVYDMKVKPVGYARKMTVKDVPKTAHLTEALTKAEAEAMLLIDNGWIETLRIALNPQSAQSLACAVSEFARDEVVVP